MEPYKWVNPTWFEPDLFDFKALCRIQNPLI